MPRNYFLYRTFGPEDMRSMSSALPPVFAQVGGVDTDLTTLSVDESGAIVLDIADPEKTPASTTSILEFEAIGSARTALSQINQAVRNLYDAGQIGIPFLFPLTIYPINTEQYPDQGRFLVEFGVRLEATDQVFLPVLDMKIMVLLNKQGQLRGLYSNWAPIFLKETVGAFVPDASFGTWYYGDQETEDAVPEASLYKFFREKNLLLPGYAGFTEDHAGFIPSIPEDQIGEDLSYALTPYAYEDEGYLRFAEEIPARHLEWLLSFGITARDLEANPPRMTALAGLLEAFDLANLLHQQDERFVAGKKHTYADFQFKLTVKGKDPQKEGSLEIWQDFRYLSISVSFGASEHERCLKFSDPAFPENNLHICRTEPLDPYLQPRDIPLENQIQSTDLLVLSPQTEAYMDVIRIDCSDLTSVERAQRKEEYQALLQTSGGMVITPEELDQFLEDTKFPTLDAAKMLKFGLAEATVHAAPVDTLLTSKGLYGKRSTNTLIGDTGELTFRARNAWLSLDLNTVPWVNKAGTLMTNFHPIWDVKGTLFGQEQLVQIKTSRAQTPESRFKTYDGGLLDIMGGLKNSRRSDLFRRIALQDFLGSWLTEAEILKKAAKMGRLAINASDVAAYKEHVANLINTDRTRYRSYFDALMQEDPVSVRGNSFQSMQQIEAFPDAAIREAAVQELINRTQSRIQSNGIDTVNSRNQADFHQEVLRKYSRQQIDTMMEVAPEASMMLRLGRPKATLVSGLQGGFFGGFAGAGFSIIAQGVTRDHIDWGEVGVQSAATGIGEGAGTALTTQVINYPSLLTRYGIKGALGGKILGGGIVSCVSAPVVELATMTYHDVITDDVDYRPEDYTSRVGSAAVGGFISGVVGSAATGGAVAVISSTALAGTALGTTIPGLGNIAGLVAGALVGIIVYAAYQYFLGKSVEDRIKIAHLKLSGEAYTLTGNWDVTDFGYFQTVGSRLNGGDAYAVRLYNDELSILNPIDGEDQVFVKVEAIGANARAVFGEDQPVQFIDKRLLSKL